MSRAGSPRVMGLILFLALFAGAQEREVTLNHFTYRDGAWDTRLTLYNPLPADQLILLEFFDIQGNAVLRTQQVMPAQSGFEGQIRDLDERADLDSGWIRITASHSSLSGLVKFTYLPTGATASLPLQETWGTHLVIPMVEDDETWNTGFALTNLSDQINPLTCRIRDMDGRLVSTSQPTLMGHEKKVAMLQEIFPDSLVSPAIMEVTASYPVSGFGLCFQRDMKQIVAIPATVTPNLVLDPEDQLLGDTFRIDIKTIHADFEYTPGERWIQAQADVFFVMRPGQTKPLFHLSSAILSAGITQLAMDGEVLDPEADLRAISFEGSTQQGVELQYKVEDEDIHQLSMTYRVDHHGSAAIYTNCNDIDGVGNEVFFPTLNVPSELARHILNFRLNTNTPYTMIGSGKITRAPIDHGHAWTLDTDREIASYTCMFAILPDSEGTYHEQEIDGVMVRLFRLNGSPSHDKVFSTLENWLPELRENLGPFPMPHGLAILLTTGGGGMEYYGGTMTSMWALTHEVFHMYFACSVVAKTYRDSWWDEAITKWYEGIYDPIEDGFRSNMVSGRSPIAPGFDIRAYEEGARIMEAVAQELGGREGMIGFLHYLVKHYTFSPFTTRDFLDYLDDYAGIDMRDRFDGWLYSNFNNKRSHAQASPHLQSVELPF